MPLDVAMQANVAGVGNVTATLVGNKLTVNGTVSGLRSPATDVHIHRGPKGIPGPAILDLAVTKDTNATISGSLDLTPQQVQGSTWDPDSIMEYEFEPGMIDDLIWAIESRAMWARFGL